MFERGLTGNSVDERLLIRLLTQYDRVGKKGSSNLSRFYSYPVKEGDQRIDFYLSKAFQKKERISTQNFYQGVRISISPNSKKKTLKGIEKIQKNLRNSLKKSF